MDAPLYDELQATPPPSSSLLPYMVGKEPGALLYFRHNFKGRTAASAALLLPD